MNYTSENTLAEILHHNLKAAFVFRSYNLNYNTESKKTLKEACNIAGIKPEIILTDLKNLISGSTDYNKFNDWEIDFLCDYIESNHHKYVRKIMPKILSAGKTIFKNNLTEIHILKELEQLRNDFESHMQKEERLVFPYIKKLNKFINENIVYEIPPFGSLSQLVKVLEKEHSIAGRSLSKIKESCNGYKFNKNSDENIKAFYGYLNEFDNDFHIHIHLENNILYPKSISQEKKLNKTFFKK